ncbi:hypothetical protein [Flavobacterium franklandianum]|uniref:Uncharacterized protein n=1 Tax=Flavobacterium franklandianum TaxID=2594430 RepID=A0A553CQR6_9FLAO|nr:hypothetical protein [Flavobacterium franklandianum]TRX22883.1 hypothetical protein FNW17_03715 [Flavobacterium franklandianum]
MKKLNSIILVILSVVLFSCSKEDESSDLPTETIKIEDDLKINFADLTAVTIEGEAKVDAGGNFSTNTTNTVAENLPLLFIKDNEIMFGYYSKTGLNNSISTNDILLFYFTLHPEIALQGFQNTELLTKIEQHPKYDELKSLIKTSLNANTSPFKNTSFVSLLNKTGLEIGIAKRQAKQSKISKTLADTFKFSYTRNGTVEWNKKFPLYATVGMEVVDAATGVSVSGPQIFDNQGLVFSISSAAEWIYDYFTTENSENIRAFKFPKEGKYELRFTNGIDNFGTKALEEKVDLINRYNIGVNILSFAMPVGIKKLLVKNDCRDATIDIFKNMKLSASTFVITDELARDKFVYNLAKDAYAVSVKCIPSFEKKYLDFIENITSTYLNKLEEASTLYLLLRDYAFSDIKGKETRNYYDGISFGELQLTNTTGMQFITPTGTEFSGQAKSEHTYTASVNETTFKYSINTSLIGQSTITLDPASKEYAIGLPFEVNKINSGDSTLKGNKIIPTSIEGKLAATFVMGTQETKFEIKPAFKNSGLSSEYVNLKIIDSISIYKQAFKGKWKVRYFDGVNGIERFWDLELFEDGTGIVKNPDPNVTLGYVKYPMRWNISGNGPYYYNESGWWNFQFGFKVTYPVIKYTVESGDGKPATTLNPTCGSCINKYITEYTKN